MCQIADLRSYRLIVAGALDAETVAEICPPDTRMTDADGATTLSIPRTDQAALIGVLRQLHNLGYTLLRVEAGVGGEPRQPRGLPP